MTACRITSTGCSVRSIFMFNLHGVFSDVKFLKIIYIIKQISYKS